MQLTSVRLPLFSRIPISLGWLREVPGGQIWVSVKAVLPSLKSSILVLPLPSYLHSQSFISYLPFILHSQSMRFYFHYIYKHPVLQVLNSDAESRSPHPHLRMKSRVQEVFKNVSTSKIQHPEKLTSLRLFTDLTMSYDQNLIGYQWQSWILFTQAPNKWLVY